MNHPERVQESYIRYLRRQTYEFFDLKGAPVRIWFRSRFKLRSDEELQAWLDYGVETQDPDGEWLAETAKTAGTADVGDAVDEQPEVADAPDTTDTPDTTEAAPGPQREAPASDDEEDFWEDEPRSAAEEEGKAR